MFHCLRCVALTEIQNWAMELRMQLYLKRPPNAPATKRQHCGVFPTQGNTQSVCHLLLLVFPVLVTSPIIVNKLFCQKLEPLYNMFF